MAFGRERHAWYHSDADSRHDKTHQCRHVFAGVLSNAAYLKHVKSWVDAPDEPQNLGHFFILIDTKRLGSSSWLVERMRDFAEILHASAAAEEGKPVIVPGEIELRNMARQRADGIDVDAAVFSLLRQRATQPLA